jgi:2-polyprenyl-6-methoxyphenol hydroxylase-like FAD-dependent oxidoreductase
MSVLIVGAGPTGLVLAHELARFGIQCRVIDKAVDRSITSRAIGIMPRTMETFNLMGIAEDFLTEGCRIQAVNAFDGGERIARIAFNGLDTPFPFALGLPQNETERILEEHVAARNIKVERGAEIIALDQDGDGVFARIRARNGSSERVRFDYLVGCDGAHSTVRHLLGLPFRGGRYRQTILLADVVVQGPTSADEAHVYLNRNGVTAIFPLLNGLHRLIATDPLPHWGSEPTLEQCQYLIDGRGLIQLRLAEARWISTFQISHGKVDRLKNGRVFLAGDAAHIHSPMGAQGMNAGIQDAFNLAWKLGMVESGLAQASLLSSYDAERMPIDTRIIQWTDRATRILMAGGETAHLFASELLSSLMMFDSMRSRFALGASQIGAHYRRSPIVEEHRFAFGPRAGDRAPDATVVSSGGQLTRLFDLFAHAGHTLLLLWPEQIQMRLPENVLARSYTIGSIFSSATDFSDGNGVAALHYGREPAAYLIRPDGYVAFRCRLEEVLRLLPAYWDRVYRTAKRSVSPKFREAA